MAASPLQGERKHKLPGKSSLHLEPGGFAADSFLGLCPALLRQAKVSTRLLMTRGPRLQSSSWMPFSAPIREDHAISKLRGAHCQKCRLQPQFFQGQGADQGGRHTMKVTMTKFINGLDSGNLQRIQQSQQQRNFAVFRDFFSGRRAATVSWATAKKSGSQIGAMVGLTTKRAVEQQALKDWKSARSPSTEQCGL